MPEVDLVAERDNRIDELRSTHECYEERAKLWCFYESAYQGGAAFANGSNVFKHQRENMEDYADRVRRIANENYCKPLVDFYTNFIFSESIDRNGGKEKDFYDKFVVNVDKKKSNVDTFMRSVCEDTQIYGMSYIMVDMPNFGPAEVMTKQDEIDKGIHPYWIIVKPQEITDWLTDDFDNFMYAKRKQIKYRMATTGKQTIEYYTEMYVDRFEISEIDVTDPTNPSILSFKVAMPNKVGAVPLVLSRYEHDKIEPYFGVSFLIDFAFNNRRILNISSLLDEFLYRQCFNVLAMEMETTIPTQEQTDGNLSTSNALIYPKDSAVPQYIAPDIGPADFLQKERANIKNEMYIRAAQDSLNELFNGESKSGFSQAQSFSKTVPFIANRADNLEAVEGQLMVLTLKFLSRDWDGKIKYKDRYEITNLNDALTQLMMLARDLQMPSETFVKEQLKRMVNEYDGKLPAEILAKIYKEIDDLDFKPWLETQKNAMGGTSPAAQQKPKSKGTMAEASAEAKVKTGATKKPKDK